MLNLMNKRTFNLLRAYHDGPDHPFKLRLFGWILSLLNRPKLVVPYLENASLCIDPFEYIGRRIIEDGVFESEVWDTISLFAKEKERFWDIGAHYGNNAILAARDRRIARVDAFECSPYMLEILKYNSKLNANPFVLHAFGLSSSVQQNAHFFASKVDSSKASLTATGSFTSNAEGAPVTVPLMTMDEAVGRNLAPSPTIIKMDVEGHELEVLRGGRKTLAASDLKAIVFESKQDGTGRLFERNFISLFQEYGFKVVRIARKEMGPNENYLAFRGTLPPPRTGDVQFVEA